MLLPSFSYCTKNARARGNKSNTSTRTYAYPDWRRSTRRRGRERESWDTYDNNDGNNNDGNSNATCFSCQSAERIYCTQLRPTLHKRRVNVRPARQSGDRTQRGSGALLCTWQQRAVRGAGPRRDKEESTYIGIAGSRGTAYKERKEKREAGLGREFDRFVQGRWAFTRAGAALASVQRTASSRALLISSYRMTQEIATLRSCKCNILQSEAYKTEARLRPT